MSTFIDYLHEVFELFGHISPRKMFGVHGIYHNKLMIGIVADEQLYLRADDQTRYEGQDQELIPFIYDKGRKPVSLKYYLVPEDIYEDPEEAARWAEAAYQAALRA